MTQPHLAPSPEELARLREGLRILALHVLRDPAAAEDAAQESMARVLVALRENRLEDPARLGAFARGVARHVITDVLRAQQRHASLTKRANFPATTSDDALAALVTSEESARVRAAILELSTADRELLQLSFFDGLTPAEIGDRLGEPAPRVRKRKERALARLRAAFLSASRHATTSTPTSHISNDVVGDEAGGVR